MRSNKTMKSLSLLLAVGFCFWVIGTAGAQQGFKQTDRLIKRAEDFLKEIEATRQQVQKSLILYNSIVEGTTDDPRKAYKDLTKAIQDSEKKAGDVQQKVEAMEQEAHKFFAEWTQSLDGISNQELQKKAQERLNKTRVDYGDILAAGRRAGADFDPLVGALQDQVVYLGYDLNPAAVSSLKEDAAKIAAQANQLTKAVDEVVKITNSYIDSLRP